MRAPAALLLTLLLSAAAPAAPPAAPGATSTPAAAARAALADLKALPADRRPYARYFSLYSTPQDRREGVVKALTFWVNSISREVELIRPRRVSDDLYAVDVRDYGWKAEVWERLKDVEPYFHALVVTKDEERVVTELWPGGVWPEDGRHYAPGAFKTQRKVLDRGGRKSAQAPWLDAAVATELVALTQSQVPVVRADWFLFQTGIQKDRKAGYYDFLGLGKASKDFEDLIGADREKSVKLKREVNGILARSGVTLENRVVVRLQSLTGGWWVTQDYKTSVDRQNVIRLLDKDLEPPAGDASEQYGVLPNGLFAFWLQNDKGERQDAAPDFIASDAQAGGTDRRVHIGLSCVRCHVEGIRPVNDYARRLYKGSVQLASPDYEKFKRLRQLYLSDLDGKVADDSAQYAKALHQLVGLKPAENARGLAKAWDDFAERDLTPDDAARELGVDRARMVLALKEHAKGGLDPVLAQLIQDPPLPLRRSHFDETFSLAQAALRGYRP